MDANGDGVGNFDGLSRRLDAVIVLHSFEAGPQTIRFHLQAIEGYGYRWWDDLLTRSRA